MVPKKSSLSFSNAEPVQVIGSRNPHNTVKALFKALNAVRCFVHKLCFKILS